VEPSQWETACRAMEREFAGGRWEQGLLAGIAEVSRLVAIPFPAQHRGQGSLPDRPTLL
jgi:uncharacterized membrane protein